MESKEELELSPSTKTEEIAVEVRYERGLEAAFAEGVDLIDISHRSDSEIDIDLDFSSTKKKKKKKPRLGSTTETAETTIPQQTSPAESDPVATAADYPYDFLLSRAFQALREKNPSIEEDLGRRRLVMRPPQVLRVGSRRTSFANFVEVCRTLHRAPHHLQSFLLCELGTNGSVDGSSQLVIRGKFLQRQVEGVLRRYIREYVTCHTCRSAETLLQRESRLCFLQCEACGSRCSVATIKCGFQAVVNKRAAMRAKEL